MGNSPTKYDLTPENLATYENEVLKLSKVDPTLIVAKDVKVGEYNKENVTIRTIICGTDEKPKLIYTHGYGGSGALFFKCIGPLMERFQVILIDIIGMGGSSRPKNYKEHEFTP